MVKIGVGLLLLSACGRLPSDPEHSLDNIRARGTIRVGGPPDMPPEADALLRSLGSATGARPQRTTGPVEPLLQAVEDGDLDLVIAPFRKDSPSATTNALSPPIRTQGHGNRVVEWRAAMRNGENRWISLVEIHARQIAGAAR